jgi:hypothetical protein
MKSRANWPLLVHSAAAAAVFLTANVAPETLSTNVASASPTLSQSDLSRMPLLESETDTLGRIEERLRSLEAGIEEDKNFSHALQPGMTLLTVIIGALDHLLGNE